MKTILGFLAFKLIVVIAMLVTWIVNLVKLINCDFYAPFKEEIIHAVGVIIPPASFITVWF